MLPKDSESLSEADSCPQQMEVTAFSCKHKLNNSKKGHDCVETVAQTKLMMLLRQIHIIPEMPCERSVQ